MKTGIGIRPELFQSVLDNKPNLGFVEAHSENYFGDSLSRQKLLEVREHYPVSLHGVGLSLGRADDLNQSHLAQLKALVDEVSPLLVSEHLAWSAYSHQHLPDLLPLPLNEQALEIMCQHVEQMQDVLQRQILVENPSNYLIFDQLQIPEPEFLNTLAQRTGCQLLIDVNNIHVSAVNTQRDSSTYIAQLDSTLIGQYHLAGYTEVERNGETVLIDTHNQTVYQAVWDLFETVITQHGQRPTLFEWDSDFPEFDVLLKECGKADQIAQRTQHRPVTNIASEAVELPTLSSVQEAALAEGQADFLNSILTAQEVTKVAINNHQNRISIYQNNVFAAIHDYLADVFPATQGVVGADFFKQLTTKFIQQKPPSNGNIHLYGEAMIAYVGTMPNLRALPYLADLLQYEWALHHAYFSDLVQHAGQTLNPHETAQDALLTSEVIFNPSVMIVDSSYPISEIHRQSLPSYKESVEIDLAQSQDALLVYKQDYQVHTKQLNNDENTFLQQVSECSNLLQAIEATQESVLPEVLSSTLAFIFDTNLLMLNVDDQELNCTNDQVMVG